MLTNVQIRSSLPNCGEASPERGLSVPFLLATSVTGVLTAYLFTQGLWHVAVGLIVFLPSVILLYKHPFLAVILWLLAMPFLLQTQSPAERQVYWMVHRALPPLTLVVMLVASTLKTNRRIMPALGLPEFAMAGYLAVSMGSIFLQNETPLATAYIFYDRVFIPMCLYLIVRLRTPSEKEMRWLIFTAFFIAISQTAIGILSWVAPQILPSEWIDKAGSRTEGSLVNASVYTTTLIFAGLLTLHSALNSRRGLARMVLNLAFLLSMYGVFASFSRASWIAAAMIIMGLIILYLRFMIRLGVVVCIIMVLLGGEILTSQLSWARERLYSQESGQSAASRLPVYMAAYRMFEAKPFLGWGYDNFDLYDRRFQERVAGTDIGKKDHTSHNAYFTLLAEQGLVGFLLFLAPLAWWLTHSLKVLPRMPSQGLWSKKLLIILWLVILSHVVVYSFHPAWVVFGLGLWWLVLGLIAGLVHAQLVSLKLEDPARAGATWRHPRAPMAPPIGE